MFFIPFFPILTPDNIFKGLSYSRIDSTTAKANTKEICVSINNTICDQS